MKRFFFLLSVVLLAASGCTLFDPLPPGEAPKGAIVNNHQKKDFDESTAVNYITTSLSIYLLTDPLPEKFVAIDADEATAFYARQVLNEIARVTGIQEKPLPGAHVLHTRFSNDGWDFKLISNGKKVWKERLELSLCRQKESQKKK